MADYNLTQTGAEVQVILDRVAAGYIYMGTADLTTTPDTTNPNVCYLLSAVGTYTSFGNIAHSSGIGIALWNGTAWSYQNVPSSAVVYADVNPTENSTNPVQSGGVWAGLQYSVYNPLAGMSLGDKSNDAIIAATLKEIWLEIIDQTASIPDTMTFALYKNRESDGWRFQICNAVSPYTVLFSTPATTPKMTGVNNVTLTGVSGGGLLHKANIHLSLDFTNYTGDFSFSRGNTTSTTFTTSLLNRSAGSGTMSLKEKLNEVIDNVAELEDEANGLQFEFDGIYKSYTDTSNQRKVKLYIDDVPDAEKYYVKIDCTTPPGSYFSLSKCTLAHSGFVSLGTEFTYGEKILIEKDNEKPSLYIYGPGTDESLGSALTYVITTYSYEPQVYERLSTLEGTNILTGKNIVCFGDSLTEFADQYGKRWSDYFQELTGANVINVGIGGTQLRQRRAPITLFNATTTYNVGDWVFYKPSSTMNCYECTQTHSGAWNGSHFSEIAYTTGTKYGPRIYSTLDIINVVKASCDTSTPIATRFNDAEACAQCIKDHEGDDNTAIVTRLAAIDWSEVDAVIVLGGANDYTQNQYGTADSFDVNTTLGAINEIVKQITSTYTNIVTYCVSEPVRWFDYTESSPDDTKWGDVFVSPSNNTYTYKAFIELVMEQFKTDHIPVCDLYNGLGWTKYNFSYYFKSEDGTHPTKNGMMYMGKKIASFVLANNSIN